MYKSPFIYAVNTTDEVLTANSPVTFNSVVAKRCKCISFLGNIFSIKCAGAYRVSFDADINATTTGNVAVQITNNGIPIATDTVYDTNGVLTHLHIQTVVPIRPSCRCIDNSANIQVILLNGATLANPSIIIDKI